MATAASEPYRQGYPTPPRPWLADLRGSEESRRQAELLATGDDPAVNSIYLRLQALNPAVRGHNVNVAVAGSRVDGLSGQADQALATQPLPGLFLIQTMDCDIRPLGSHDATYGGDPPRARGNLRRAAGVGAYPEN